MCSSRQQGAILMDTKAANAWSDTYEKWHVVGQSQM